MLAYKPTSKAETDDFEKLYQDHKQMEAEHKKLGSDFDLQQENLKEVWTELARKTETLAEEQTRAITTTKMLEEAAREKMELNKKHYEEVERAKMVLDKLQTTYQNQVLEYEALAQVATALIQKLKNEKQVVEDSTKLGVERIKNMVTAWRNRIKANIDDYSMEMWMQWSQQAAKLQTLREDAENIKKAGDNYKMDEESIVPIREELSDDFFSLAESHLGAVWRLVERFDDY